MGNNTSEIRKNRCSRMFVHATAQSQDETGLFDQKSRAGENSQVFGIEISGSFLRHRNEIYYSEEIFGNQSIDKNNEIKKLVNISFENQEFIIGNAADKQSSSYQVGASENDLWLILDSYSKRNCKVIQKVNKLTKQGQKLTVGDQIKLGRFRLNVNEIYNSIEIKKDSVKNYNSFKSCNYVLKQYDFFYYFFQNSQASCRICLSVSNEVASPLIAPCNCSGSIANIHVSCLQEWFKNKIEQKCLSLKGSPQVTFFAWKNLECELCKKQYAYQVEVDGAVYDLFQIEKPKNPYIIFESLTKDKNNLKGIYLINMNHQTQLKIGRGSDINMRLLDISVSRVHSYLNLWKGNFYISDGGSKFGTMILIKDKFQTAKKTFSFLVAQTKLHFQITPKESIFCCLGKDFEINFQNRDVYIQKLLNLHANLEHKQNEISNDEVQVIEKNKMQDCKENKLQNEMLINEKEGLVSSVLLINEQDLKKLEDEEENNSENEEKEKEKLINKLYLSCLTPSTENQSPIKSHDYITVSKPSDFNLKNTCDEYLLQARQSMQLIHQMMKDS